MSGAHGNWRHRLLIAALTWLLILFVVGVLAATRGASDEVSVRLLPGTGAQLSKDGGALVLPGDPSRDGTARLQFELPPPDPQVSRWVIWVGRDPLESV